jgi:hypothetical protein
MDVPFRFLTWNPNIYIHNIYIYMQH